MKKLFTAAGLLVLVLFISGCSQQVDGSSTSKAFTAQEVAQHNNRSDCWTIIHNNVYDITDFISQHPGGVDRIDKACGIDATQLFETKDNSGGTHTDTARAILDQHLIGILGN
jgi:cytochrome b involved in lipid metabolism